MLVETMNEGQNKYRKTIKEKQRVTLYHNGKVEHLFKLTFFDGSTAVYDTNFNYVMGSYKANKYEWRKKETI